MFEPAVIERCKIVFDTSVSAEVDTLTAANSEITAQNRVRQISFENFVISVKYQWAVVGDHRSARDVASARVSCCTPQSSAVAEML